MADGLGQEKNGISGSVGYGRESDNQNSVTKSGINTQNIEIRNENAQQALTGKSITETLAAIKTDISTDNAESQSGKLENRFDKNEVLFREQTKLRLTLAIRN